jgi:hypothetical protein
MNGHALPWWPVEAKSAAMFWGYFDESGTHEDPEVFALAGYVGGESQWQDFERSWLEVLRSENVDVFHMAPLCSMPRRKPFRGWEDDRAENFLGRLFEVIEAHFIFGFSAFVRWRDFNAILKPALVLPRDGAYKNPYVLCLQACMGMMTEHWPQLPYSPFPERIACVFDRNHVMRGQATEHFFAVVDARNWANRFHVIAFAPKHIVIPLQAADLLAYETYRYGTSALRQPDVPKRKELDRLTTLGRCLFSYINAEKLTELAEILEGGGQP